MNKVFVIAAREYQAAVRTKAFLIGLLLMPVLMSAGGVIQYIVHKQVDIEEKRFAIVDRTPGKVILSRLEKAAEQRNQTKLIDPKTKKQIRGALIWESIEPSADINQQRLDLSERVQKGEFFGFLEIGPKVCDLAAVTQVLLATAASAAAAADGPPKETSPAEREKTGV